MWKCSEGTHSNKNSRSISREESGGLSASTFCVAHHSLEDVKAKWNTHTTQQSSLIAEIWQNISGENLRLLNLKVQYAFHIWTNNAITQTCKRHDSGHFHGCALTSSHRNRLICVQKCLSLFTTTINPQIQTDTFTHLPVNSVFSWAGEVKSPQILVCTVAVLDKFY